MRRDRGGGSKRRGSVFQWLGNGEGGDSEEGKGRLILGGRRHEW